MRLPDPASVRTDPAPPGFHYEWVTESIRWRVVPTCEAKQCRWRSGGERCTVASVAKLNRSRNSDIEQWWHYCADHMFGRRVDGPRVWVIHMVKDTEDWS